MTKISNLNPTEYNSIRKAFIPLRFYLPLILKYTALVKYPSYLREAVPFITYSYTISTLYKK